MTWLPYVVIFVIVGGLLLFSFNARRRQAAIEMVAQAQIGLGTEVMTTSGLYGTVVARNDDGTVLLAVAPGVEVRWALAALRDVRTLPDRYRGAAEPADPEFSDPADGPGVGRLETPGSESA